MFKFSAAVILLLAVNGALAFWGPCPGGLPAPHFIASDDCDDVVCTVFRGGMLVAEAHMFAVHAHQALTPRFSTVFLGIEIVFNIPPEFSDACQQLRNDGCPTVVGREYIWDLNAPIGTQYPAMSNVPVRAELREGTIVGGCAIVNANVR